MKKSKNGKTKTTTKVSMKGKPTWISEAKQDGADWVKYGTRMRYELDIFADYILRLATSEQRPETIRMNLVKAYGSLTARVGAINIPENRHFDGGHQGIDAAFDIAEETKSA